MRSADDNRLSLLGKARRFFGGGRRLWTVLAIAVLAMMAFKGISLRKNMVAMTQNQNFRLTKVTRGPIEITVTGTGTVKPSRRWELSTRLGGKLTDVFVEPGEQVDEGQSLAQLDTGDLLLKLDDTTLELKQAETAFSDLKKSFASLTVKAKSGGALTKLNVSEGQSVMEGAYIGTITSPKMEVKAYFNESQVRNIAVGQSARVFLMDFLSEVQGSVAHVSQAGQAREGGIVMYTVTVHIENQGALIPGMPLILEIDTPKGTMKSKDKSNELLQVVEDIFAETSGKVGTLFVSEGDLIKSGQLLLEMESEILKSQMETQDLKIRRLGNQLKSLNDDLRSQTVTAPEKGTVLDVKAQPGDTLSAGTVIAIVANLNSMEVILPIDEIDLGKVKPGQEAVVTADAFPGKAFPGTVLSVALEAKSTTGIATFDAKILVQSDKKLLSGMSCDVSIKTDSRDNALLLPVEALQITDTGYMVWFVPNNLTDDYDEPESQLTSTLRRKLISEAVSVEVETGLISSNHAEILSGLSEGDTVLMFAQSTGLFRGDDLRFHFR